VLNTGRVVFTGRTEDLRRQGALIAQHLGIV